MPREAHVVAKVDMSTLSVPRDQFDTQLVPQQEARKLLRHSTGLVCNWVSLHGCDSELEAALDAQWPFWLDCVFDAYGSNAEDVAANCELPLLMTCHLARYIYTYIYIYIYICIHINVYIYIE